MQHLAILKHVIENGLFQKNNISDLMKWLFDKSPDLTINWQVSAKTNLK